MVVRTTRLLSATIGAARVVAKPIHRGAVSSLRAGQSSSVIGHAQRRCLHCSAPRMRSDLGTTAPAQPNINDPKSYKGESAVHNRVQADRRPLDSIRPPRVHRCFADRRPSTNNHRTLAAFVDGSGALRPRTASTRVCTANRIICKRRLPAHSLLFIRTAVSVLGGILTYSLAESSKAATPHPTRRRTLKTCQKVFTSMVQSEQARRCSWTSFTRPSRLNSVRTDMAPPGYIFTVS